MDRVVMAVMGDAADAEEALLLACQLHAFCRHVYNYGNQVK